MLSAIATPYDTLAADNLALMGRTDEAREIFERLRSIKNDVGLLSEEYNPAQGRLMGNFPQALSHIALVNACRAITPSRRPIDR